jgi:hypothetical protein
VTRTASRPAMAGCRTAAATHRRYFTTLSQRAYALGDSRQPSICHGSPHPLIRGSYVRRKITASGHFDTQKASARCSAKCGCLTSLTSRLLTETQLARQPSPETTAASNVAPRGKARHPPSGVSLFGCQPQVTREPVRAPREKPEKSQTPTPWSQFIRMPGARHSRTGPEKPDIHSLRGIQTLRQEARRRRIIKCETF